MTGELQDLDKNSRRRIVWKELSPFMQIPNVNSQVGRRAYKTASRRLDSKMNDVLFIAEYEKQRTSFKTFLLKHNLAPYPPLQEFLNRDMRSFLVDKSKGKK
jgi:hypothetical protein